MIERITALESDMESQCDRISSLESHMYGNGKDGVLIRLDRVEQSRLAGKDRLAIWVSPIVAGVIAAIVGGLIAFIK